ncbi:MAG: DUF2330 domain-containing protein [Myxococcota bacterium]
MVLIPARAAACGGLFCSGGGTQVVNQVAERILFVKRPDGRTTAVVEIQYQGPAPDFAWVLPVPGTPEVGVSSTVAFDRLQQRTNPSYRLAVRGNACSPVPTASGCAVPASSGGAGGATVDAGVAFEGTDPVTIVDRGTVGPYDYVTLSVQPEMEDPADVAVEWLEANDYDVTALGPEVLRPYLVMGMNLMAFRLTKGSDTGSIRPLMLTYESEQPMIPIRPTAVAAERDMGILVWVTGPSRALPATYRHLVLNEAALDWRAIGTSYARYVGNAANEAGGHGFVTEYAAPTEALPPAPELPMELRDPEAWGGLGDAEAIEQVLRMLNNAFSRVFGVEGVQDVIEDYVPLPPDVDARSVLFCATCVLDPGRLEGFDLAAFLAALDAEVLAPVVEFEALLAEQPYLTRLFTTLSPEEMTVDPEFAFATGLPDASNLHDATLTQSCRGGVTAQTVQLEDGTVVRMPLDNQPWEDELPYVLREEQLEADGTLSVRLDNEAAAADVVAAHNASIRSQLPSDEGCGAMPLTTAPPLLALCLVQLRARRRRR